MIKPPIVQNSDMSVSDTEGLERSQNMLQRTNISSVTLRRTHLLNSETVDPVERTDGVDTDHTNLGVREDVGVIFRKMDDARSQVH